MGGAVGGRLHALVGRTGRGHAPRLKDRTLVVVLMKPLPDDACHRLYSTLIRTKDITGWQARHRVARDPKHAAGPPPSAPTEEPCDEARWVRVSAVELARYLCRRGVRAILRCEVAAA